MKQVAFLCLLLAGLCTYTAQAQVKVGDSGELSGRVFSDFYWIPMNHNEDLEGSNGFWIRRIYLTYENELSNTLSSRLRLEMSNEGDFRTESKMVPVVKDAYLKWSNDNHSIYAGISGSPTWGLVESIWAYRSMEKTPLDLQKMGSSRDLGVAAKGQLGTDGRFGYHAMFGNGNSNANEVNNGKKVMLSLNYQVTDNIVIEGYADYNKLLNDIEVNTFQGFAAYETEKFSIGALYAYQHRTGNIRNSAIDLNMASLFTHFDITGQMRGILRMDHMFDRNPDGDRIDYIPFSTQSSSTLIITGLDFKVADNVSLMPNVETVFYWESSAGAQPDTDVIPRMTLLYKF
jgi:hypothetical protein